MSEKDYVMRMIEQLSIVLHYRPPQSVVLHLLVRYDRADYRCLQI